LYIYLFTKKIETVRLEITTQDTAKNQKRETVRNDNYGRIEELYEKTGDISRLTTYSRKQDSVLYFKLAVINKIILIPLWTEKVWIILKAKKKEDKIKHNRLQKSQEKAYYEKNHGGDGH